MVDDFAVTAGPFPRRGSRSERLLVTRLLADRPSASVAVLSVGPTRLDELLRSGFPKARVTRVDADDSEEERHVRLAAAGPFDLILDATERPEARGSLFTDVFFHLRPGGAYVALDHIAQKRSLEGPARRGGLSATIRQARALPPIGRRRARADAEALGRAIAHTVRDGGHLVVTSHTHALVKLREAEMNEVLELRRESPDRVLATVPAATFDSRCRLTESTAQRLRTAQPRISAPEMSLREYHDVLCAPGQVAVQGNLLLPDTYRHNERPRLGNRFTQELGRRFATLPGHEEDVERLPGTYFFLDSEFRGHFGHAMTEQLSRMWALPLARQAAPDLKAIFAVNTGWVEIQSFEFSLWGAAGFAPEDLVLRQGPTRVERLLAATPMLSMPQYIHPDIAETWDRIGRVLVADAPEREYARRIFISRRLTKRACLNTDEVELMFAAAGFEIVYPEDHPMGEQVAMFQHAEVIGGFAGSGLFNMCFASEKKIVIMLAHSDYNANNEYLMASVRGHDIVRVVSEPEPPAPSDQGKVNAFQSPFRLDLDQEGLFLRDVLHGL